MANTIQVRRGTAAELVGVALTQAELGYATDTDQMWVGDGSDNHEIAMVDVTPPLANDLDLNDKYISLKQEPTADDTGSGIILPAETVDENTFGIACALHKAADEHWEMASANETTTHCPCTGIAITAGTGASKKILLSGIIRHDAWNWTVGPGIAGLIYLGETAGVLTQTAPSSDGDMIQVVGFALSDDTMMFNPQLHWIEHS